MDAVMAVGKPCPLPHRNLTRARLAPGLGPTPISFSGDESGFCRGALRGSSCRRRSGQPAQRRHRSGAELLTMFQLSSDSCPDTEKWGRRAAPADLGDKLVVPLFDQAGVLVVEIEDGEDLLDECFVFWVVHAWPPGDLTVRWRFFSRAVVVCGGRGRGRRGSSGRLRGGRAGISGWFGSGRVPSVP